MRCDVSIEFQPSDGIVPGLLDRVESSGFPLMGLKLIPCPSRERSTLQLDLGGCPDRLALGALAQDLMSASGIIDVIHVAESGPRPLRALC